MWLRGGRELIFLAPPDRIMATDISTGDGFRAGAPHELFRSPEALRDGLAVTGDGNRFLIVRPGELQPPQHLTMLVNWQNEEER